VIIPIIISLLSLSPLSHAASKNKLNFSQQNQVKADHPIQDLDYDDKSGTAAFYGKNYFWVWETKKNKLTKIDLHGDLVDENRFIATKACANGVLAISEESIDWVSNTPLKIKRYDYSTNMILGIGSHDANIWWITPNKMFLFDTKSLSLTAKKLNLQLSDKSKVSLSNDGTLIFTEGRKVKTSQNQKISTLFINKNNILGIQHRKNYTIAWSKKELIWLSSDEDKPLKIPVQRNQNLIATYWAPDTHRYIFQDGSLISYELQTKSQKQYQVTKGKFNSVKLHNSSLSFIDNEGYPTIIKLNH
tara:strand:+ start:1072 stop:1980 length:909 start_codon:yes stop_codon:yes gene_type:complete